MSLKIKWENCNKESNKEIESWISCQDRYFLCLENKTWGSSASEIEECLKYCTNGQFRNVVGFINNKPVVAAIFGVEFSGKVLRLYELIVNPKYRDMGIGKLALKDILGNDNIFNLKKTYNKFNVSILPQNKTSLRLFSSVGLKKESENKDLIELSMKTNIDKEKLI